MIFLTKLKQNLKFKILSIDNVSKSRKNILILIIMQKKTMKCNQREKNVIDVDYHNENNKNFKNNFKYKKNKLNNKFNCYNDDATTCNNDKFNDFYDNLKSFKNQRTKLMTKNLTVLFTKSRNIKRISVRII